MLPAEPVLVGRGKEITQLMNCLETASSGKGTTIFILGEAGVGKTRLVNEFLALAKKAGAEILSGWCLSEAAIPYFPLTEAFNAYVSTSGDEKEKSTVRKQLGITGWLTGPEFTREPRVRESFSTPEIQRDRTFEAVTTSLLELSARKTAILFLDDLQWADHLSLALLHYLSRKNRNSRLLIIGTYRPEELVHSKEKRLHPLEETMFSMSRENLLTKMELTRLKQGDFPEFLRSIFHTSMKEEFVRKLYEETEGNPFFALETLNLLAEDGAILEKEGRWTLTVPLERIGIPSRVHEVITQRVARLEREERKMIDFAAVSGFSFHPDTLSRTLGLDIGDVLRTLVEVERRHRLIRATNSTFEFAHHKIRETIYADLPSEMRKIYHLKIACCLEQALTEKIPDSYLADVALHYVEGGALEKAFRYLLRLGEKAVDLFANVEALEYLNRALEAAQKDKSLATNENLTKIHRLRGIAWLRQDEKAKARNDFNLMLQNATSLSDESMMAEAHYFLGCSYEPYFGEKEETIQHLTAALEMARKTGNKRLEARSLGAIGDTLMFWMNPDTMDEGRMRLDESVRIAREIDDQVLEASNLFSFGMYYSWRGEFDQAKESISKALELYEAHSRPITYLLFSLGMILGGKGEYNDAIANLQRCIKLGRDSGSWSVVSMALNTLGWIYLELSNVELAIKYNNEALEFAREHQKARASGAVPSSLMNLGMNYLEKNDYENAERYFEQVVNAYEQHRLGTWRMETRILLGRGEISLARGDYTQALRSVEDSLAISKKADAKKYIAKGLKLKAEILARTGNTDEAVELMQNALELAQAMGNPPTLWQTHYALGLLLEKRGSQQRATEHYAKAAALIKGTASGLEDTSLKNALLAAPKTKAILDAYAKIKPTPR